ncbi:MAG: aldose epimerase family protein [Verrucomicrobiota bacterium]
MRGCLWWGFLFCFVWGDVSMGQVNVEESVYGETADGRTVVRYDLSNGTGMRVSVLNYGAMLIGVEVPNREGEVANVTLYLDEWSDYESGHPLFGSVVGRFANRIDGGGFEIDGVRFDLETVNARTGVHVHGGKTGFQRQVWEGAVEELGVALSLVSPDGHEGYPGEVAATVRYLLAKEGMAFRIHYEATTTKATHVNLTNHADWNLGGAGSGDVLDHELQLEADQILELDERKIPTGGYVDVAGGPWDFLEARRIGEGIGGTEGGYDHCYVLSMAEERVLRSFARLHDPESGRVMEIATTQPGVQIYSANFGDGKRGAGERMYGRHEGICFETQHYPNAPNEAGFPSTLLRPGERYFEEAVFSFSVND